MTDPRVSLIILTHNRCAYVQEAIDSVLAQTYTDYEIIVIDDGSTDGTGATLLQRYGDRIRYEWHANQGESASRNRGLEMARGEYLGFLDDDDRCLPIRLASQVAYLDTHADVDLVAGGVRLIDEAGDVTGLWRPWDSTPELTLATCVAGCPLFPSIVLFRRRVLERLDHWFDPELDRAPDTDFFLRLLLADCTMVWVREPVSDYRLHGGSMQWDARRYDRAKLKLYDELFAQPDLPRGILAQRDAVYGNMHLSSACRYIVAGDSVSAQDHLRQAAVFMPAWVASGELLERVLRYPESPIVSVDAKLYREHVLASLPADLDSPTIRRCALARVAMSQMFAAAARSDWATVRAHWWQGVRQDPSWLRNRGVWAIGLRALASALAPVRTANRGSGTR